ncbi:MAG: hypothetical protein CVU39_15325 [Chloroflexi bacterium HGW-Chloroflexi-10]|nr:MAG: hypothetical protein CVU39_15325 [Chloroflexi bacterium HGW-Chloroflexi-10]
MESNSSTKPFINIKFEQVFNHMPEAYLIGDLSTQKVLFANRAMLHFSGYSYNEISQLTIDDILIDQSHHVITDPNDNNYSEGFFQSKNGNRFLVEVNGSILEDDGIILFILMIRDITERKTKYKSLVARLDMEAMLAGLSTRFINLDVNDIPSAIQSVIMEVGDFSGADRVYIFEFDDGELETMTNTYEWCSTGVISRQNILVRLPVVMFPWWIENFRKGNIVNIPDVNLMPPEASTEKEMLLLHSIRSVLLIPLFLERKLIGFLGFEALHDFREWPENNNRFLKMIGNIFANALAHKKDVIALQQSEKRYRDVVESSPNPMVVLMGNQILMVNSAAKKILRISESGMSLKSSEVKKIISPKIYRYINKFLKINATNKAPIEFEYINSDNERYILDICLQKISIDNEIAVLIMATDLTSRKILESEKVENIKFRFAIDKISLLANSSQTKQETLQFLADQLGEILHANGCFVSLWDNENNKAVPVAAYGPYRHIYRNIAKDNNEPTLTASVLKSKKIMVVPDVLKSPHISKSIAEKFPSKTLIGIPILHKEKKLGAVLLAYNKLRNFSLDEISRIDSLVEPIKLVFLKAQLHEEIEIAYDQTLEGWARAIEYREHELLNHTRTVTKASVEMGVILGFSNEDLIQIKRGALLHDIGKMGIEDRILLKNGKLSDEEFDEMKKHTTLAYEMLKEIRYLKPALDIPLNHHEHWDGGGYPRGLRGEEIPLFARIFTLVDVWDALSSKRPYKEPWPKEKIRAYLLDESGKLFDPTLVPIFLQFVDNLTPDWFDNLKINI